MQVILRENVENLGRIGDIVKVSVGYARNFLLPRKLAEVAAPGRVAEVKRIEAQKALHEARTADGAALKIVEPRRHGMPAAPRRYCALAAEARPSLFPRTPY